MGAVAENPEFVLRFDGLAEIIRNLITLRMLRDLG